MSSPSNHTILQGGYCNAALRGWQSRSSVSHPDNLIYPLFISHDPDAMEEITSLPGQYRIGVNKLIDFLKPLTAKGLKAVLLFGVVEDSRKDPLGDVVNEPTHNPVFRALHLLKQQLPTLLVACDVCICGHTSHGHCGHLNEDGSINNGESVKAITKAALNYALNGADIVAPSDMMDGRIGAISDALKQHNLRNQVSIMSYSAKFASAFYGPFRDACSSAPSSGDRKCYQLPPGSSGLASRAVARDVKEEADILMVKPGMPYLDIVKQTKQQFPDYPLAIYQVSGEYAMLWHAAQNKVFNLKTAVLESVQSMHRAGADIIITYYAPQLLDWLKE